MALIRWMPAPLAPPIAFSPPRSTASRQKPELFSLDAEHAECKQNISSPRASGGRSSTNEDAISVSEALGSACARLRQALRDALVSQTDLLP